MNKTKTKNYKSSISLSLTWHWMISYVCILILPIALCFLYGLHTYQSVKQQNLFSLQRNLTLKSTDVEKYLLDTVSYFDDFYLNDSVRRISFRTVETYCPADRFYIAQIIEEIANLTRVQGKLVNVIIYFPNIQTMVDQKTLCTNELASAMQNPPIEPYLLDRLIASLSDNSKTSTAYCATKDRLFLASRLHTTISGATNSFIIYEVDAQRLLKYLETDIAGTSLMITNSTDRLFYQSDIPKEFLDNMQTTYPQLPQYSADNKPVPLSGYGQNYYLSVVAGTCLDDFYYIYITEKNAYDHALTSIISFFLMIMVLSLLLGSLLITYFIKKNYRPIKEIIAHINPEQHTTANEYNLILDTIKSNSSELKRQQQILSNNYLLKMLTGEISFEESISNQSGFQPTICESHLCVSLIQLENCPIDNRDLYQFITKNVLSELLSPHQYTILFATFSSYVVAIMCCDKPGDYDLENIHKQHCFLYDFFQKNSSITLTIGISDHWTPKENLHHAYTQAKETLEYIHFYQYGPIYLHSQLPAPSLLTSTNIYNTKDVICFVTKETDSELSRYFDSLYQEFSSHPTTLQEGRNLIYYYYQLLTELQLFLLSKYPVVYSEHWKQPDEAFLQLSITEAATLTKKYFLDARRLIASHKNNHMQLLVQQVRSFIDNNYFDVNMNQTTIANYFHITPAYLAQKFKDEYGESIIQYLYSVRIQHSMELLKKKELKISEIATIVGFTNANSYIRVFKQFTGFSPGKYTESEF